MVTSELAIALSEAFLGNPSSDPIGDPEAADEAVSRARWPDGVACPKCGFERTTRRPSHPGKRFCVACSAAFSIRIGTVMQGSRTPIEVWVWLLRCWGSGMDPFKIEEELGRNHVRPETARSLMIRLENEGEQPTRRTEWVSSWKPIALAALAILVIATYVNKSSPQAASRPGVIQFHGIVNKDGVRHFSSSIGDETLVTPILPGEDEEAVLRQHTAEAHEHSALQIQESKDSK